MLTSSVQIHHLFRFAEEMKLRDLLVKGLNQAVVASIGPTTSGTLRDLASMLIWNRRIPRWDSLLKRRRSRVENY